MNVNKIQTGLWHIGIQDEKIRILRNVSFLDSGMVYGAYLMDAGAECILIGSVPKRYMDLVLDEAAGLAENRPIRSAVFFGTADDAANAQIFSTRFPDAYVIAGTALLFQLKELGVLPGRTVEIRTNRTLKLGNREMTFCVLADRFETPCVLIFPRWV